MRTDVISMTKGSLTGALDYARGKAKEEARAASEAIAGLPDSSYRESLLELSAFAVERDY